MFRIYALGRISEASRVVVRYSPFTRYQTWDPSEHLLLALLKSSSFLDMSSKWLICFYVRKAEGFIHEHSSNKAISVQT